MSDKAIIHHVKILPGTTKDKDGEKIDQVITQTERLEGRKRIRRKYVSGEIMPCSAHEKESLIKRGLAKSATRLSVPGFGGESKEGDK